VRRARDARSQHRPEVSFVVAAYNVEPYVGALLASIFGQEIEVADIEVVVVDDGSTDGTRNVVADWMARHRGAITYCRTPNRGAAEARNHGMSLARGRWLHFVDADDILAPGFCAAMFEAIADAEANPENDVGDAGAIPLALFANLVFYREETDTVDDSHPLRHRFSRGVTMRTLPELGRDIVNSVAHGWLDREAVVASGLRFDSRVRPTFEDGHFINRLFLANEGRQVVFVPDAHYLYRKRAAGDSLVNLGADSTAWVEGQMAFAYLDLLDQARAAVGMVPRYLQVLVLYQMGRHLQAAVFPPAGGATLSPAEGDRFMELADKVFSRLDADVIASVSVSTFREREKVAVLGRFKGAPRRPVRLQLVDHDPDLGAFQFSYLLGGGDTVVPVPMVNGEPVAPMLESSQPFAVNADVVARRHWLWVPASGGDRLAFDCAGTPGDLRRGSRPLGAEVAVDELLAILRPASLADSGGPGGSIVGRILGRRHEFEGCWVLSDAPNRADDNGEHLYRHLMRTAPERRIHFALNPDSPDWTRLHRDGFNLVAWGSDEHIDAHYNADIVASSHAEHPVLWPAGAGVPHDVARFHFVYLKHGMAVTDLSRWLNQKPLRLLVTVSPNEAAAIADPTSSYKFTDREVVLSGLPRHDSLLAVSRNDAIVVMPTWRRHLLTEVDGAWVHRPGFAGSPWAQQWGALLASARLRELAGNHGLRVVWAPHPNMVAATGGLAVPDGVAFVDVRAARYQELLASAAVAVTDYSSAAADVAYLQRPVVYFPFDGDEVGLTNHTWQVADPSHELLAFGPTGTTVDEVVAHLDAVLSGNEQAEFAERRNRSFPLRDGHCAQRVAEAMAALPPKPS